MKTSVVISTYNGEKYIIKQLESLRKQERPIDEVLIFDDCSSDTTVQLIQNFISQYHLEGWKVQVNERNKGWRKNFIDGIGQATGDLVFPCDQDDFWHSDKIAKMADLMEKNPQIKVLASDYREVFDDGSTRIGSFKPDNKLKKIDLYTNYMLNKLPGCTYCVRKEIAVASNKYWREGYPHDALLWRLGLFSDALYVYTKPLIDWRKHNTSAFARESKEMKTKANKYQWIVTAQQMNSTMLKFVEDYPTVKSNKMKKLLKKTAYYLSLRKKLYNSNDPIYGVRLARYWNLYPRYRQYLADWYLVYVKK